jgi:hypothetical protein
MVPESRAVRGRGYSFGFRSGGKGVRSFPINVHIGADKPLSIGEDTITRPFPSAVLLL